MSGQQAGQPWDPIESDSPPPTPLSECRLSSAQGLRQTIAGRVGRKHALIAAALPLRHRYVFWLRGGGTGLLLWGYSE